MKTKIIRVLLLITIALTISTIVIAQQNSKPKGAILSMESKGIIPNSEAVTFMFWLEYEKVNVYNLIDKNDLNGLLKKVNIDLDTCIGSECLAEVGRKLKTDVIITGSVNRFGEKIAINVKVINSADGSIKKSNTMEFQNLPEIQKMIEISVKTIEGLKTDPKIVNVLLAYDKPIENANTKISLSGPRIGFYHTDGYTGERLRAEASVGGFDMYRINTSIGWQQEVQILSAGNFQALGEFIFLINGMESSRFMPSLTSLIGFRAGEQGWEFAVGPSFRVIKQAEGFFTLDENNNPVWHLRHEQPSFIAAGATPEEIPIRKNLDSRGQLTISTGFVVAAGRTFKSGYLNIPVNVYFSPRKTGNVYGISCGFNVLKKSKSE
jgi:hypothetical protein